MDGTSSENHWYWEVDRGSCEIRQHSVSVPVISYMNLADVCTSTECLLPHL